MHPEGGSSSETPTTLATPGGDWRSRGTCLLLVLSANVLFLYPALAWELFTIQTRSKLLTAEATTTTSASVLSLVGQLYAARSYLPCLVIAVCSLVLPGVHLASVSAALYLQASGTSSSRSSIAQGDKCIILSREASKWGFMLAFCITILLAMFGWLGSEHFSTELSWGFYSLVAYNCLSAGAAFALPTASDEPLRREMTGRERRSWRPSCCLCMGVSFLSPAIMGLFILTVPLLRFHVEDLGFDNQFSVLGILMSLLFKASYTPAALVVAFVILFPCLTLECAVGRRHHLLFPVPRIFAFEPLVMLDVFAVASIVVALSAHTILQAPWLHIEAKMTGLGLLALASLRPVFERLLDASERPERKALLGPRNPPPASGGATLSTSTV